MVSLCLQVASEEEGCNRCTQTPISVLQDAGSRPSDTLRRQVFDPHKEYASQFVAASNTETPRSSDAPLSKSLPLAKLADIGESRIPRPVDRRGRSLSPEKPVKPFSPERLTKSLKLGDKDKTSKGRSVSVDSNRLTGAPNRSLSQSRIPVDRGRAREKLGQSKLAAGRGANSQSPSARKQQGETKAQRKRPRSPSGNKKDQKDSNIQSSQPLGAVQKTKSVGFPKGKTRSAASKKSGVVPSKKVGGTPTKKVPGTKKSASASAANKCEVNDSDTESGYGDTTLSTENLTSRNRNDVSVRVNAKSLTQVCTETQATSEQTQHRVGHNSRNCELPQLKVDELSNFSDLELQDAGQRGSIVSNTSSHNSQEQNVVRAILEADRAVQEIMRSSDSSAVMARHGGRHSDEWINGDAHVTEETSPVRVMLMGTHGTSLTDSAKQALRRSPQLTAHTTYKSDLTNGSHPVTKVNVEYEEDVEDSEEDEEEDEEEEVDEEEEIFVSGPVGTYNSLPNGERNSLPWRKEETGGSTNQMLHREMEVLEHIQSHTTHVLTPNTSLSFDKSTGRDSDNEDAESWSSCVTEPEPSHASLDTQETGTQTPRHRTTQTPEDAATQTKKEKRRKLPPVPGLNNTTYDVNSDDGSSVISHGSNESYGFDEGLQGANHSGTQTKASLKKRKLPDRQLAGVQLWHDGESSASDSEANRTKSELMRTIELPAGHNDRDYSPQRLPNGSLPLGSEMQRQPTYLQDYQNYLESFDGTASGPFIPAADDIENIDHTGQPQSLPHKRTLKSRSVPNTVLRDSTGGAASAGYNQCAQSPTGGDKQQKATGAIPRMPWVPYDEEGNSDKENRVRNTSDRPYSASHVPARNNAFPQPHGRRNHSWDIINDDQSNPSFNLRNRQSPTIHNRRTQTGHTPGRVGYDTTFDTTRSMPDEASAIKSHDFTQQTPTHSGTQTPIRVRLPSSQHNLPRGSFGDAIVLGSELGSTNSLYPWSLIGTRDLDLIASKDFSTQTFGQPSRTSSNCHVETQTSDTDIIRPTQDSITQTLESQVSHRASYEPVETYIPPLQLHHLHNQSPSPQSPVMTHIHHYSPEPEEDDLEYEERLNTTEEFEGKDIFEGRHTRPKRRPKSGRSQSSRHDAESEAETVKSNLSRKDILRLMLNQVKDLRKAVDPDGKKSAELEARKQEKEKTKKKHSKSKHKEKSKSKSKHKHDSDSAIELIDDPDNDPEKIYSQRRLELMFGNGADAPRGAGSYRRRRHSIASYVSEEDDLEGHQRSGRRDERPRSSRYSYLNDDPIRLRRSAHYEHVSPRRAYTPPARRSYTPSPDRLSPPRSAFRQPGGGYRQPRHPGYGDPHYGGYDRRQMNSPVKDRPPSVHFGPPTFYPPPGPQPAPVMQQPYQRPYNPAMPMMRGPMTMPPQVQQMRPAPAPQVQLGQCAFRPITATPIQHSPQMQGTPMLVLQNGQLPQSPPYLMVSSPVKYESAAESGAEGRPRGRKLPKPHSSSRPPTLEESLGKATRAASRMKNITERLQKR